MSTAEKFDKSLVKNDIALKIIDLIEQNNILPWNVPYNIFLPKNVQTSKNYRGINMVYLSMVQNILGFSSNYWLTYNQAKVLGGQVRKGEKGFRAVKYSPPIFDEGGTMTCPPFFKNFTVFNASQCDGIEVTSDGSDNPEIKDCELVVANYISKSGVILSKENHLPCYSPSKDEIKIPDISQFSSSEEYYSTLFHEIAHSTGHKSRLNRGDIVESGDAKHNYSYEELVAEFASAMILGKCGYSNESTEKNSASYISHWLKYLKNNPGKLMSAVSDAQKAADLVVGE